MSDFFSVDTSDLRRAMDAASVVDWPRLTEVLGEGITQFKDELRGTGKQPGDPWPIGTVKKSKTGNKYYVPVGAPGSRRSGRSLRGWKARQRGISAVVFNDARAKLGGTFYAQHVHLAGRGAGSAEEDAFQIFEEEMSKVADLMGELLSGEILG